MLEERSAATSDGRAAAGTDDALLTRIQEGLSSADGSRIGVRRCPCCGRAIRAGQRVTTIHGTSVHVRCASARSL